MEAGNDLWKKGVAMELTARDKKVSTMRGISDEGRELRSRLWKCLTEEELDRVLEDIDYIYIRSSDRKMAEAEDSLPDEYLSLVETARAVRRRIAH